RHPHTDRRALRCDARGLDRRPRSQERADHRGSARCGCGPRRDRSRPARAHQRVSAMDRFREDLVRLSREINADPELAYEEHHAVARIAALLEKHGHRVEKGLAGLPTAFRARVGPPGPTVALLAEYDALPDVGHGCGHNLISMTIVGAFLAAAAGANICLRPHAFTGSFGRAGWRPTSSRRAPWGTSAYAPPTWTRLAAWSTCSQIWRKGRRSRPEQTSRSKTRCAPIFR